MQSKALIVDDEEAIRNLIERLLRKEGFQVLHAETGRQAMDKLRQDKPDVVLLDLNLPDLSGEQILLELRKDPAIQPTAVLIITGRDTEGLTSRCLNIGADDYIVKPFDNHELVARVHALLRRPRIFLDPVALIEKGRITISTAERRVTYDNRPIPRLTPKEFDLIRELVLHSPNVVDKNILAQKVWGEPLDQINARTLDVHIRRIRHKLGSKAASLLKTIPAVGYQWIVE